METHIKDSQNEAPSVFAKPGQFWGVMGLRAFFVRYPYMPASLLASSGSVRV
ncbi:MAG: hypothetical protein LBD58_08835 [Treponema sp.]|jgi:hypothetical protein|nr:hypothetical protein [Treponema sp.]